MRKQPAWTLILGLLAFVPAARAQDNTQQFHTKERVDASPGTDAQVNVQAYIELVRSDVRQQKAEVIHYRLFSNTRKIQETGEK